MTNKTKWIILFFLIIGSSDAFSQTLEIFGGPNLSVLYNVGQDGHYETTYENRNGINLGIGVENVKIDWVTMRFTLSYDMYGGEIHEKVSGLASGSATAAKFEKSVLSLGLYPLNFYLFKHIDVNFGVELSRRVYESFSGTYSGFSIIDSGYSFSSYDLQDEYENLSSASQFGLRARIAYDIHLTGSLVLSPQYSYYLGLSSEFDYKIIAYAKSMRHYFCIGIKMNFKTNP